MTIPSLSVSYPDFKLLETIDPEQFDINNSELVNRINDIRTVVNLLTDGNTGAAQVSLTAIAPFISTKIQAFLAEVIARLQATASGISGADFVGAPVIVGVTGTTIAAQLASLKTLLDAVNADLQADKTALATHKASSDHDSRYYTEVELDNGQLDGRYFTKSQTYSNDAIDAKVAGVNTNIKIEVFTIENPNVTPTTFTYKDKLGNVYTGILSVEGYQTFTLKKGTFFTGGNRIEAIINDDISLSVGSGGLREDNTYTITLLTPQPASTEVTFKYFETVALSGAMSRPFVQNSTPPTTADTLIGTLWIDTSIGAVTKYWDLNTWVSLVTLPKGSNVMESLLSSTNPTTVTTYTPTVAGNFSVSIYLRVIGASTNITVSVTYADASGAQTNVMIPTQLEPIGSYSLLPLFINCVAGTPINVNVTAGTANQVYVSANILGV